MSINQLIFCRCDSVRKIQGRLDYLRTLLDEHVTFKNIYRFAFDFARVNIVIEHGDYISNLFLLVSMHFFKVKTILGINWIKKMKNRHKIKSVKVIPKGKNITSHLQTLVCRDTICHDITEVLLKVALNTIKKTQDTTKSEITPLIIT